MGNCSSKVGSVGIAPTGAGKPMDSATKGVATAMAVRDGVSAETPPKTPLQSNDPAAASTLLPPSHEEPDHKVSADSGEPPIEAKNAEVVTQANNEKEARPPTPEPVVAESAKGEASKTDQAGVDNIGEEPVREELKEQNGDGEAGSEHKTGVQQATEGEKESTVAGDEKPADIYVTGEGKEGDGGCGGEAVAKPEGGAGSMEGSLAGSAVGGDANKNAVNDDEVVGGDEGDKLENTETAVEVKEEMLLIEAGEKAQNETSSPTQDQEGGGGEDKEEDQKEQEELPLLDEWARQECELMKDLSSSSDLAGEDIHPSLKGKPVTQCHEWMPTVSEFVLKYADLSGGTLFDWWNEQIAQGEPDVSVDDLFSRAVGGLKKAMSSELRKAVEAGNDEAMYELSNVVLYKNVFGAPSPPAGEADPPPPSYSWVAGGGMYALVPSIAKEIMAEDGKYLLEKRYSREEVEAAIGRPLEDSEVQEQEDKPQTVDEWIASQCRSMRYIPRKGHKSLTWDNVYEAQKDREKPVTQCHIWMSGICGQTLMAVDLDGGTLYDWWSTHIGKGETETDLSKEKLFNRALAGFHATIDAKLREAVEAGDEKEIETQHLAVTIKNVFGAPNPPDGTTGCGKDGESAPEPHSWVVGGGMYACAPSQFTEGIMTKDRKYIVGLSNSREEVEKALGRPLADDEVEVRAEEDEEEK